MTHRRNRAVLIALGTAAFACGGSAPTPTDTGADTPPRPPPASPAPHLIGLSPAKPRINAGAMVRITATAVDANQQMLPFARITWSSSQPDVATVDTAGRVTGVSPGYVTVTAASGAAAAFATVHVMRDGVYPDIVSLLPHVHTISACDAVQMHAATVPDVGSDLFIWRTTDETVLTVDGAGLVRAVAPGSADVFVAWQPDTTRRTSRPLQVTAC